MDTTAQLKMNLISRINDATDLNFLNALLVIFDSSEQSIHQLDELQQLSIEKGRLEIKSGKIHKNDEVISDMRKWLKKK